MPTMTVRYKKQLEQRGDVKARLPVAEAVARVKQMANVKRDRNFKNAKKSKGFDQTIDMVMHLGIDPKQADQALRGSFSMPHGVGGPAKKVIAFCEGNEAEKAKAAGAIEAGVDDLIEKINKGWMDFDVAVAHPSVMGKVGKLGRTLGPSGKMPSPKAGTVNTDVSTAVKEFIAGKIEYRNDDTGNVHVVVGKVSFPDQQLVENIEAFVALLHRIKPATSKGQFIIRACISGTHTPSVTLAVE